MTYREELQKLHEAEINQTKQLADDLHLAATLRRQCREQVRRWASILEVVRNDIDNKSDGV